MIEAKLGRAVLSLETEKRGLDKGFAEAKGKSAGFLKDVQGSFKKASSSIFAGIGQGIGQKAFSLVDRALSGIVKGAFDAVAAASDLNETLSKSDAVFKGAADEINAWGDTTATAMGLSKNAAIGAAAGFGDLFNKMDETRPKAVEMSKGIVQLASDLASFNNLDPTDVLDKLRAGISGEAEPLRRVGVFLTEAKVQAKALELGFTPLNGKFSEGAKIAARYALIMEETTSAQGDFARTSTEVANKQRINDAKWEDISATIGQKFLPVFGAALDVGIALADNFDIIAPILVGIAGVIVATMIPALYAMAAAAAAATGGLSLIIPIAAAVGVAVYTVVDSLDDEAQAAEAAAARSAAAMAHMADATKDDTALVAGSIDDIGDAAKNAATRVGEASQAIIDAVLRIRERLVEGATAAAEAIYAPIIAQAQLAAAEVELSEAKQELAKTKAGTRAREIAEGRVAEARVALAREQALVASYGDETAKIAELKAQQMRILQSKEYQKGSDEQKAILDTQLRQINADLGRLERSGGSGAKRAGKAIAGGVTGPMRDAVDDAYRHGRNTGRQYAGGLSSTQVAVEQAASRLAGAVGNFLKVSSPAKMGPLSELGGPEGWGERIGMLLDRGLGRTLPDLSAVFRGLPPLRGRLASFSMPPLSLGLPSLATDVPIQRGFAGRAAPQVVHNHYSEQTVQVRGALPVRTHRQLVGEMQRIEKLRTLPNRTAPAMYPYDEGERR